MSHGKKEMEEKGVMVSATGRSPKAINHPSKKEGRIND